MSLLDEAAEIVNGDRAKAYGHPLVNHACTAELWAAYLRRKYGLNIALDAEDVCWLNILQKISREAHSRKCDNLVDTVGYCVNIEMIREKQQSESKTASNQCHYNQ